MLTNPSSIPPNLKFFVEDAEDEWFFETPFDYIHARAVIACFKSPLTVIKTAHSSLVPGGYLEFQDPIMPMKYADPQPSKDSAFVRWNDLNMEASIKGGRPWNNVQHYAKWMREVGFVDVQEKSFFIATTPWVEGEKEKRLAEWQMENWLNAM
jgi:SAM-dependent methyltransferase